jgi:hypothetical protein
MVVDLVLSLMGKPADRLLSPDLHNLHLMIPAQADKDQHAALYDCIRGHIITLYGSKVIWLLCVHQVQFLLYPLSCVFFSSDRVCVYYGY